MSTQGRTTADRSRKSRCLETPTRFSLSVGLACVLGLLSACGGDSDADKRRAALGDSNAEFTAVNTREPELKEPATENKTVPPDTAKAVASGTPIPTSALPRLMKSAGTRQGARCFIYRAGQLLHATRRPGARFDWRRARYTLTVNWCVANGKITDIKPDPGSARYDGLSAPGYKWGKSRLKTAQHSDGSREYFVDPRLYYCVGGNIRGLDLRACRRYWRVGLMIRPSPRSNGSLVWGWRYHSWVRATGAKDIQLYSCYLKSIAGSC